MTQMSKTDALKMIIKHNRVRVTRLAVEMGITHPTVKKLIDNPDKMTGEQRKRMAGGIGIPVGVIDDICNGRYSS